MYCVVVEITDYHTDTEQLKSTYIQYNSRIDDVILLTKYYMNLVYKNKFAYCWH